MGRLVSLILLFASTLVLLGCPAQDWMKREDSYLSVEQYKMMTQVISINDNLYRVKRGEELNQNKITQLFINLQRYMSSLEKDQKKQLSVLEKNHKTKSTIFDTMIYVLVLLETNGREIDAYRILSNLDYSSMTSEDKNLFNLAQILQGLLKINNRSLVTNEQLQKDINAMNKKYELVLEEMTYLNKQVNALKSIEESIHSREVGLELGRN